MPTKLCLSINKALNTIELLTSMTIAQMVNDKVTVHVVIPLIIRPLIRKFAGTGIYGTIEESDVEIIATNIEEKVCFDSPCNH